MPPINMSKFGVYWGGPYDETQGRGPDNRVRGQRLPASTAAAGDPRWPDGIAGTAYSGLPAEPRAIKITVRLYDANGRFENGQVHSIVIPLSE